MKAFGPLTRAALQLLDDIGPMSTTELATLTGRSKVSMNASIRTLRQLKHVHITRYERQPDGRRGRCIPIYATGDQQDVPVIKAVSVSERNKSYRRRHAALISHRRYSIQRAQLGPWSGLI